MTNDNQFTDYLQCYEGPGGNRQFQPFIHQGTQKWIPPRWNNHSTPFTPDPLQQLRFFAPSSTVWEGNDSDIKETSIMHGGGGYYKAAHKQREREKGPVAERWMYHYRWCTGLSKLSSGTIFDPLLKNEFHFCPDGADLISIEHRRVLSRLRSVL